MTAALTTILAASIAGAAIVVALVRWDSLRRNVLDVPNERSSHTLPTPRGGGVGIVVAVLGFLALMDGDALARWTITGAMSGVAIVGWIDDHRPLPPLPRFLVHVAAGLALAWFARTLGTDILPGIGGAPAFVWWVFWTVSSVNVTNFMDGIDAFIGLQLLVYAIFAAVALRGDAWAAGLAIAGAGASLGFLIFNWPPARIFLGDVGSGACGVLFVALGVMVMRQRDWSIVHAFFPLLPLFADEAITMARRMANREPLAKAHRTHVYQRLVQSGWSHRSVSVLYAAAATACAALPFTFTVWSVAFVASAIGTLVVVVFGLLWMRSRAERSLQLTAT